MAQYRGIVSYMFFPKIFYSELAKVVAECFFSAGCKFYSQQYSHSVNYARIRGNTGQRKPVFWHIVHNQRSLLQMFCRIVILKNFANFGEKFLLWSTLYRIPLCDRDLFYLLINRTILETGREKLKSSTRIVLRNHCP